MKDLKRLKSVYKLRDSKIQKVKLYQFKHQMKTEKNGLYFCLLVSLIKTNSIDLITPITFSQILNKQPTNDCELHRLIITQNQIISLYKDRVDKNFDCL